ncbi:MULTISPECIES: hypothetical protein [unclassified Rhizobium]|uniref:hypothetical protein n=1 Tax=unclassified Rhizobium TaxID=2613769 RepID=UPI0037F18FAF
MVQHLSDVAAYCQQLASSTHDSVMGATREFIARYTVHPANPATDPYYANITSAKAWDTIMTDLWKCIPAVSDPTQRYPSVLCYDATDLMIMILAALGVRCRSVRCVAVNPVSAYSTYPAYLDHTFAEAWAGTKWSAQDAFFNVEYVLDQYTFASADDLCGISDLNLITPRNKAASGWTNTAVSVLKDEDFYAAIEHRDMGGGPLNPVVNGQATSYAGATSMVVINESRGNFDSLFCVASSSAPTSLRQLITSSTRYGAPTVASLNAAA